MGVESLETGRKTVEIPGYDIEKRIGAGGMGEVLLATQQSLGRRVAIKLLMGDPGKSSSERLARFEREARFLSSLSHPNIVPVIDRGVVDGRPFIVMEYVEGESLRQCLHARGAMGVEETLALLAPVADALSYMHDRDMVHRDVKPGNILIGSDGSVKLVDFGLASIVSEIGVLTQGSTTLGTLDYAAPEQRHGLDVDERADVFSLAVVAYQMLTSELPLGTFDMPSELKPELSTDVDDTLKRALARDPDERYPTVSVFFKTLVAACRSPRQRKIPKRGLVVAGAVIVIGLAFWIGARMESRGQRASSAFSSTTGNPRGPSLVSKPDRSGPSQGKRDVNTASAYQFEKVTGVGPDLAARIVQERERRGGFTQLTQLLSVPGIGEKRYAALVERFHIVEREGNE